MIYPIKIYNKNNKVIKEFDAKEALQMFIGDTYQVSKVERKEFWDREWSNKNGVAQSEKCGPIKYKKRKRDRVIKCEFCSGEVITSSDRRKWCSDLCRNRSKKKEDPNAIVEAELITQLVTNNLMENSFLVKCKNCRKEVRTTSPKRKWCTEKCRKSFKRLAYKEDEIEWEIERGAPYAFHVYLHYKPKNMTIMQASEHNMIQAKEFCIRELEWRLKNWDEYQKSKVRDED